MQWKLMLCVLFFVMFYRQHEQLTFFLILVDVIMHNGFAYNIVCYYFLYT